MPEEVKICDSVQGIIECFPENKRTIADYVLEGAHMIFDTPIGGALSGANGILQTIALMQGRRQYSKMVKYISGIEETRAETEVQRLEYEIEREKIRKDLSEFNRMMDFQEIREEHQYQIQKEVLTYYVDRQYQSVVDRITREFQKSAKQLKSERRQTIRQISDYTESALKKIDSRTRDAIRYEEAVCAAYRNETALAMRNGVDRTELANRLTFYVIEKGDKLSEQKMQMLLGTVNQLMKIDFISFSEYLSLGNYLR